MPILTAPPKGWSKKVWNPKGNGIENIPLLVTGLLKANHREANAFSEMALSYSIDVGCPQVDGMSFFMLCVALGHTDAAMAILNENRDSGLALDLTLQDSQTRTLVFYASYCCLDDRSPVLKRLLEMGADATASDSFGVTPFLAAARNGDAVSAALLINKPFAFKTPSIPNPDYVKPEKKKKKRLSAMFKAMTKKEENPLQRPKVMSSPAAMVGPWGETFEKTESVGNLLLMPRPAYVPGNWKGISGMNSVSASYALLLSPSIV